MISLTSFGYGHWRLEILKGSFNDSEDMMTPARTACAIEENQHCASWFTSFFSFGLLGYAYLWTWKNEVETGRLYHLLPL